MAPFQHTMDVDEVQDLSRLSWDDWGPQEQERRLRSGIGDSLFEFLEEMMRCKSMIVFVLLMLSACSPEPDNAVRERIFFQCLKSVPAGPAAPKYNDWAEVVEECGSQAYMMSFRREK